MAFASWLRYCSDVAQQKATKPRTMFGRFLDWYTIYTFSAAVANLPRNGILPGAEFILRPATLAVSCWQRTALEQWARAKLCGFEHRAPTIFGRATITLGIGPHSSWYLYRFHYRFYVSVILCNLYI